MHSLRRAEPEPKATRFAPLFDLMEEEKPMTPGISSTPVFWNSGLQDSSFDPVCWRSDGSGTRCEPGKQGSGCEARHPDDASTRARADPHQAPLPRGFAPRPDSTATSLIGETSSTDTHKTVGHKAMRRTATKQLDWREAPVAASACIAVFFISGSNQRDAAPGFPRSQDESAMAQMLIGVVVAEVRECLHHFVAPATHTQRKARFCGNACTQAVQ